MYDIKMLKAKKLAELIEIAEQIGIKELTGLKKQDIIDKIVGNVSEEKSNDIKPEEPKVAKSNFKENRPNNGGNKNHQSKNFNKDNRRRYKEPDFEFDGIIESEGVLEIMQDGYGFLRSSDYNYLSSPDDIYVSQSQIKLFGLKTGDTVHGTVRPPKDGEKYFPLIKVNKINGLDPKVVRDRVSFEHLTPLFPEEKFNISSKESTISTRTVTYTQMTQPTTVSV